MILLKSVYLKGLSERAKVLLTDYRNQKGQFDGIASIEMFEAVGPIIGHIF